MDDEGLPATEPMAPCDDKHLTLEELDSAADIIPAHCVHIYTLEVLDRLLKEGLSNYTAIMEDGYEGKFDTYAEAVVKSAGSQVTSFIYAQHGNNYFDCIVSETTVCCNACDDPFSMRSCKYCDDGECYGPAPNGKKYTILRFTNYSETAHRTIRFGVQRNTVRACTGR